MCAHMKVCACVCMCVYESVRMGVPLLVEGKIICLRAFEFIFFSALTLEFVASLFVCANDWLGGRDQISGGHGAGHGDWLQFQTKARQQRPDQLRPVPNEQAPRGDQRHSTQPRAHQVFLNGKIYTHHARQSAHACSHLCVVSG